MPQQLIYTSAPRLLGAGRTGFGTVAKSASLGTTVVSALERASQFARTAGMRNDRVIYFYLPLQGGGGSVGRICDAGADHTGRTNHCAHHVVLTAAETHQLGMANLTPVDVVQSMSAGNRWVSRWEGEPRVLGEGELPINLFQQHTGIPADTWAQYFGRAEFAALLAGDDARSAIVYPDDWQVSKLGDPLVRMFGESACLLPGVKAWQVGWTTNFQPNDELSAFTWAAAAATSPQAQRLRTSGRKVVDLSDPKSLPIPSGVVADLARTGRALPEPKVEPIAPNRAASQTTSAQPSKKVDLRQNVPATSTNVAPPDRRSGSVSTQEPSSSGSGNGTVSRGPVSRRRKMSDEKKFPLIPVLAGVAAVLVVALVLLNKKDSDGGKDQSTQVVSKDPTEIVRLIKAKLNNPRLGDDPKYTISFDDDIESLIYTLEKYDDYAKEAKKYREFLETVKEDPFGSELVINTELPSVEAMEPGNAWWEVRKFGSIRLRWERGECDLAQIENFVNEHPSVDAVKDYHQKIKKERDDAEQIQIILGLRFKEMGGHDINTLWKLVEEKSGNDIKKKGVVNRVISILLEITNSKNKLEEDAAKVRGVWDGNTKRRDELFVLLGRADQRAKKMFEAWWREQIDPEESKKALTEGKTSSPWIAELLSARMKANKIALDHDTLVEGTPNQESIDAVEPEVTESNSEEEMWKLVTQPDIEIIWQTTVNDKAPEQIVVDRIISLPEPPPIARDMLGCKIEVICSDGGRESYVFDQMKPRYKSQATAEDSLFKENELTLKQGHWLLAKHLKDGVITSLHVFAPESVLNKFEVKTFPDETEVIRVLKSPSQFGLPNLKLADGSTPQIEIVAIAKAKGIEEARKDLAWEAKFKPDIQAAVHLDRLSWFRDRLDEKSKSLVDARSWKYMHKNILNAGALAAWDSIWLGDAEKKNGLKPEYAINDEVTSGNLNARLEDAWDYRKLLLDRNEEIDEKIDKLVEPENKGNEKEVSGLKTEKELNESRIKKCDLAFEALEAWGVIVQNQKGETRPWKLLYNPEDGVTKTLVEWVTENKLLKEQYNKANEEAQKSIKPQPFTKSGIESGNWTYQLKLKGVGAGG